MSKLRILIENLIVEGIADDLQQKYPDLDVSRIATKDPSKTKKYLRWMLKQIKGGHTENDLVSSIRFFDTNNARFQKRDINGYDDLKDLEDEIKKLGQSKTRQKDIAKQNAVKLYEDDDILMVRPDDKKSCMAYGAGTKWCITMGDARYYEQYTGSNVVFYFFIDKKINADPATAEYSEIVWSKIAMAIQRDEDNELTKIEYFTTDDKTIDVGKFVQNFSFGDAQLNRKLIGMAKDDAEQRPKALLARLNFNDESTDQEAIDWWTSTFDEITRNNPKKSYEKLDLLSKMSFKHQRAIATIDRYVGTRMDSGWHVIALNNDDFEDIQTNKEIWTRISDGKKFVTMNVIDNDARGHFDGFKLEGIDDGEQVNVRTEAEFIDHQSSPIGFNYIDHDDREYSAPSSRDADASHKWSEDHFEDRED